MTPSLKLPDSVACCVVGAGVHGLSFAWHLALEWKRAGRDPGPIVVLDKKAPGAGASGIACGVVRNFYFSPAMSELVRLSAEVWESDPQAFGYQPVGYIAAVPKQQVQDLEAIFAHEAEAGYAARLYMGERDCTRHMRRIFPDFHCEGIQGVLHEERGGFASPPKAVEGLAAKASAAGVMISSGVEVTGFDVTGGVVTKVHTTAGDVRAELVMIGGGPWSGKLWRMLGLPETSGPHQKPTFTYWQLREGSIRTREPFLAADGRLGPVVHLDHAIPLLDHETGRQIDSGPWGIYWKKDATGVQGGGVPIPLGTSAEIEPYGRALQTVDTEFQEYFRAGLAWAMDRFRQDPGEDVDRPNGGIGCFTADNYPIIDLILPNVYFIADSNHGFKLLGAGKEMAAVVAGRRSPALEPFRYTRFQAGATHPVSQSPFPWN